MGVYLEDVYVRPEHRRRDCSRFEWVVLIWNEPAIRFYGFLGAEIQSDFRICRVSGDALSRLAAQSDAPF